MGVLDDGHQLIIGKARHRPHSRHQQNVGPGLNEVLGRLNAGHWLLGPCPMHLAGNDQTREMLLGHLDIVGNLLVGYPRPRVPRQANKV